VNVVYIVGVWAVEGVVVVVGGVGSYKSGEVSVVMDVQYGGVVLDEGVREEVVIACVSYAMSRDRVTDARRCCGVCSTLCDLCVGRRVRCEEPVVVFEYYQLIFALSMSIVGDFFW